MIHSRFWRPAPDLACGWLVFNEYNAGADHIEYENGKSTSAFPLYNVSPSVLLYLFLVFLFLLRSTLCFVSFTLLADLSDSVLATTSPWGGISTGSALSNRVKEIRERRVQEERGGGRGVEMISCPSIGLRENHRQPYHQRSFNRCTSD